jgi:hypothetical protein
MADHFELLDAQRNCGSEKPDELENVKFKDIRLEGKFFTTFESLARSSSIMIRWIALVAKIVN